ncbi:MAG: Txe/YoeB family addiction module toxin [Saprospiraceae bacterium]
MKKVQFHEKAHKELFEWADDDFDTFKKIERFLKEISRDPFKGIGKPEPLKHEWKGYWSRRLTDEHRLIYKIENDMIIIASLKGHYD